MEREWLRPRFRRALIPLMLLGVAGSALWSSEQADRLAGPPPGGVTGKVMNSSGEPLSGVQVTLRRGAEIWTAETDREGIYCFCRVAPARDYTVLVVREGYARVMQSDVNVSGRRLAVFNLVLRPEDEVLRPREKGGSHD